MNPKVSIIIPVYGVEKFLRQCLNSVTGQTLKEIEIIIVDDGSKDGCPAIIDEYAAKDQRITAIHKENAGYGAACNSGLAVAGGEYVAILEPDDFVAPEMYEKLYTRAALATADIVGCGFFWVDESGENPRTDFCRNVPDQVSFSLEEAPSLILRPSIWAAIYRREFLNVSGIKMVEAPGAGFVDINFIMETFFASQRISYLREPLYYYRPNAGSSVKRCVDGGLEAQRWQETDETLERYPARLARLAPYVYQAKINIFKGNFLYRIDKSHRREMLRHWQPLFQRMDSGIVLGNPIFSRLDRRIFTAAKNGRLRTLCWHLLGERKKAFISIRVGIKRLHLILLRNQSYRCGFHLKIFGVCDVMFCIGNPNEL